MSVELPPLPEKAVIDTHLPSGIKIRAYTADQMRACALEALKARKPLTDEQINHYFGNARDWKTDTPRDIFHAGARFAERSHGIGEQS